MREKALPMVSTIRKFFTWAEGPNTSMSHSIPTILKEARAATKIVFILAHSHVDILRPDRGEVFHQSPNLTATCPIPCLFRPLGTIESLTESDSWTLTPFGAPWKSPDLMRKTNPSLILRRGGYNLSD